MEEQTKITHTPSITLKKGQKAYSWEIRACGDDLIELIKKLEEVDNVMINKFNEVRIKKLRR
jgi:hypothetical protein